MKIRKAVIPAAGIGTRFLPWTKSMPKEMLPIVDKPVIQYVVEECVNSGIKEIIIVYSQEKEAIKEYFSENKKFEEKLKQQGKIDRIFSVQNLLKKAKITFILQTGPYGNATPILASEKVIGKEPFAVLWGDQFIWAKPERLKQCLSIFEKFKNPVIAGIRVGKIETRNRGMCQTKPLTARTHILEKIWEKPGPEKAPSDLAAYGTYLLTPDIFPLLKKIKPTRDGEYWLVDAINLLARKRRVLVHELSNAKLYDAGTKLNYHKTVIDFMFKDKEIGQKMKDYLKGKKLV